jgi:signal transduction histidine kinase
MYLALYYSNAQKFTPAGGSIHFDVRIVQTDGRTMLRFTCCDTGCGIAAEVAERLFQPFACSSENNQSGTGLGLYSVSSAHINYIILYYFKLALSGTLRS